MATVAGANLLGFNGLPALAAQQQQGGLPWWTWLLIVVAVILILLILWSWLSSRNKRILPAGSAPLKSLQQPIPPVATPAAISLAPSAPDKPPLKSPQQPIPSVATPAAVAPAPSAPVKPPVEPPEQPMPPAAATPVPSAPVKPDDLTVIEGIGPKIASVLQAAEIATFTQLAGADPSRLDKILKDAALRLADPTTWREQARLAAEGKWDELQALQDTLKGGRRVE
jgi:predicted flap endonuclease-1-like 5' DNA nuclease